MQKNLILVLFLVTATQARSQQIDSLFFHLYTDSLKKGMHNYINVDGKMSNGRWVPLTGKDLLLTASGGNFVGNELVLPVDYAGELVRVKATLKSDPNKWIEREIWVKQRPDPELPAESNPSGGSSPTRRRRG